MSEPTSPSDASAAKQILRARALALARPTQRDAAAPTALEVVEFRLGQERYALETRYVREVQPLKNLTPVPCTPAFVLGIVNVRGRIVPVLDLKRFFGLPANGLTDMHRVILVAGNDLEVGLLADMRVDARTMPVDSMQSALPATLGSCAQYLKGLTGERLAVLDMDRILADPKIIVHEEVEN
jgi:purine-binding chemotaxis protein CheW